MSLTRRLHAISVFGMRNSWYFAGEFSLMYLEDFCVQFWRSVLPPAVSKPLNSLSFCQ